jgi:hypothetical protein
MVCREGGDSEGDAEEGELLQGSVTVPTSLQWYLAQRGSISLHDSAKILQSWRSP